MRGVDGVINVGRIWQKHLTIGQNLGQRVLVRAPLYSQLEHSVPYHLRRPLVVREHDGFVQHHTLRLHVVALHRHFYDVKVGRTLVRVARARQADHVGAVPVRGDGGRRCQSVLLARRRSAPAPELNDTSNDGKDELDDELDIWDGDVRRSRELWGELGNESRSQ